tara:strand:- start:3222 stop:3917 length:696 start_codon:yes stop_codon:yes gene_type:complete
MSTLLEMIPEVLKGAAGSIVAVVIFWKMGDILRNKNLDQAFKRLIKSKGFRDISFSYLEVLNILLDDSMARNKVLKIFAIYINVSLFKALANISEQIAKSTDSDKKAKTVVGLMISEKMKKSSRAQLFLFLALIANVAISFVFDNSVSIFVMVFVSILLLCIQIDHKLIEYRVNKGWYGKNEFETLEIIEFIIAHADKNDFNDSGGLKKVIPQPKTVKENELSTSDNGVVA